MLSTVRRCDISRLGLSSSNFPMCRHYVRGNQLLELGLVSCLVYFCHNSPISEHQLEHKTLRPWCELIKMKDEINKIRWSSHPMVL